MLRALIFPGAALLAALACTSLGCAPAATAAPPPTIAIEGESPTALLTVPSSTASAPSPRLDRSAPPIAWVTSEPDARARARKQGLPLLVVFTAQWATAGVQMDRDLWKDRRVQTLAQRFVPLRIDVTDTDGDAEGYAQTYGVTSIPEVQILDPSGKRLATFTGAPGVERLVEALRDAASAE